MNPNPFSPSFAILPSSFYGRKKHLERYTQALDTPGSAYRLFFLTGTRGSGKTSLLHQFALIASQQRWDVLKTTNIDALDRVLNYAGLGVDRSRTRAIEPKASMGGVDVTLGRLENTRSLREPASLLSAKLIEKISTFKRKQGLAIIVDEAQKLSREDTVRISNAVQDVKLEGLPVSLVLCGLPSSYNKLRSYKDCTFIRRMKHEKLWPMGRSETAECLGGMFAKVPEMMLDNRQLLEICQFTGGHPYLMQLVGDNLYRLFEDEFNPASGIKVPVPSELIEHAQAKALAEYKENVLDDVLGGVHQGTREYLEVAFSERNELGYVNTADVNRRFRKNAQEMSGRRASALNTQIVKAADRGRLKFALPHYRYIFEPYEFEDPEADDDEWNYF